MGRMLIFIGWAVYHVDLCYCAVSSSASSNMNNEPYILVSKSTMRSFTIIKIYVADTMIQWMTVQVKLNATCDILLHRWVPFRAQRNQSLPGLQRLLLALVKEVHRTL